MKNLFSRDWTIIILMTMTIVAMLAASYYALHAYVGTGTTIRTVEAVCDYSHSVIDGKAEEACARAQDASGMVYKCTSYEAEGECYAEEAKQQ